MSESYIVPPGNSGASGKRWLRSSQIYWNLTWKSPGFVPFGANLTHFEAKPTIPDKHYHRTAATWHLNSNSTISRQIRYFWQYINSAPMLYLNSVCQYVQESLVTLLYIWEVYKTKLRWAGYLNNSFSATISLQFRFLIEKQNRYITNKSNTPPPQYFEPAKLPVLTVRSQQLVAI